MGNMVSDGFQFDLKAKNTRISDENLISAIQAAAEIFGENYFTSKQYDALSGKRPHSETIIKRFGSWKKALTLIGITGGRERQYAPEMLVENLENIWRQLGRPPGKRQNIRVTVQANVGELARCM